MEMIEHKRTQWQDVEVSLRDMAAIIVNNITYQSPTHLQAITVSLFSTLTLLPQSRTKLNQQCLTHNQIAQGQEEKKQHNSKQANKQNIQRKRKEKNQNKTKTKTTQTKKTKNKQKKPKSQAQM